ncbi:tetratricopeptide repeat protein [Teredinibacter turnerae]|uniref:tetratricopeptide repeat protein n=1 Tax=Teredinibacter turnerae TaxID=2426 RepID=UPI003B8A8CF1
MASAEQNFGESHPTTAVSYSNLASVLSELESYESALSLVEKAHCIFKQSLPHNHPYVKGTRDWCERLESKLESASD